MFGIYDDLNSDHIPGLQKYDMCMTEQVPGSQGVKIVGRHIASAPKGAQRDTKGMHTDRTLHVKGGTKGHKGNAHRRNITCEGV